MIKPYLFACPWIVGIFLFSWPGIVIESIAQTTDLWQRPKLVEPNTVNMRGDWGNAFTRGIERMGKAPYEPAFILSDVSFTTNRWFTNYSGDISGRFIEVTSLASSREKPEPAALLEVLKKVADYQKPDGHFGAVVDWSNPEELRGASWDNRIMPLMWGNGRLLLGLTASAVRFNDAHLLESAKKLGDFYVNTASVLFCDPQKKEYYSQNTGYASAYVTCVYEGMEGLVQLYRATHEVRFLNTARKMADFHEAFDRLPVNHSHGSLSEHEALILLYEDTGDAKYLDRVVKRWERIVNEGFVSPVGGVLEKFVVTGYERDEGCSESDWLRLNLMLWRNTGNPRYLDMAERTVSTELAANQWPDGGFGHRVFGLDATGPYAFLDYSQEALWCCAFHGALGLRELKSYLVTSGREGIELQFGMAFEAPVSFKGSEWRVESKLDAATADCPVRCQITLTRVSGRGKAPVLIRIPEWAESVLSEMNGKKLTLSPARKGYVKTKALDSGSAFTVSFHATPYLENRRLKRIDLPTKLPARMDNVVVHFGPHILVNNTDGRIQTVVLSVDSKGHLQLPQTNGEPLLVPWNQVRNSSGHHAFVINADLQPVKK